MKEKAQGTLIVPVWKSAPFSPKISHNGEFVHFIRKVEFFDSGITKKGRGKNGIFGNQRYKFGMVAMEIAF